MPQNGIATRPAVNPSGVTKPLSVDANNYLRVTGAAQNGAGADTPLKVDDDGRLLVNTGFPDSAAEVVVTTVTLAGSYVAGVTADVSREVGGAIWNTGTAAAFVFFGAATAAADSRAMELPTATTLIPAGTIYLDSIFGGEVYTGAISFKGTAGQTVGVLVRTGAA